MKLHPNVRKWIFEVKKTWSICFLIRSFFFYVWLSSFCSQHCYSDQSPVGHLWKKKLPTTVQWIVEQSKMEKNLKKQWSRGLPPNTAPLFLFNHKLFPQRSNSPSYTADHHFRIPAHTAHDLFHIQTNSSHGQFSHCSNSLCQPRPPLPAHCILALPAPSA